MLKTFYKKLIVVTLVTVMILSVLPMAASAEPATLANGAIYASGDCSKSGNTLTATATTKEGSGCTGSTFTAATATVTVKNASSEERIISFDYNITLNGGTVTINDESITSSGTYSATVAAGASFDVVIKSSDSAVNTTTIVMSNFTSTANAPRNITVNGATGGKVTYTYDGTNVSLNAGQSATATVDYQTGLALTATASNGYVFGAWFNGDSILSTSSTYTVKPVSDMNLTPLFLGKTDELYQVGGQIFFDLTSAINYAGSISGSVIVPLKDCTVPAGNYTIPSGVTLLVPFDDANTVYTTEPETINSHSTPSPYRILTLADGVNITVASGGVICVPSKISGCGQNANSWNGTPTGKHGRIHMNEGSSITLQSGAFLYCYGYISGSGSVTAKSGSTVWEAMQFRCWRGGSASYNMQNGVFPMSQYYVQNVEAPLTLESGSTEKVFVVFNAQSTPYSTSTTFIGSGGMFVPSGSVTKRYDSATDRLIIDVNGNLSVSAFSLSLKVSLYNVNLNTSNYDSMPINSNITVHVHSGTTTVNQSLGFLPGSELSLDQGAVFSIANDKKVFVYDKDEWGPYACASCQLVPVGYSTANGTTAKRTEDDLVDAKLDINGTVNVSGYLYTTESGANIISSKKTGKIVYNKEAPSNTTTQQATQSDTDITKVNINITSAKLHNGDDSYTATAGSASGDYYTYNLKQSKWIKGDETYTVTWENFDGTLLKTNTNVKVLTTPSYDGATPVRTEDNLYIYTFSGWSPELTLVTDDVTYTAEFAARAKFDVDEDGDADIDDIALIIDHFKGNAEMTASQLAKADIDGDGVFDAFDAAKFENVYLSASSLDGDVNMDGDVNLVDYAMVKRHISGEDEDENHPANLMSTKYLDSKYDSLKARYGEGVIVTQQYYLADVNRDKAVDAFDLFYIDKIII